MHRLWAHRSYDAHWSVRVFMMLINSMANQGSIYHWSRDHRVHHKYSETDADPHNAKRGFFFAHMGWLYVKKHPEVIKAGRTLSYADLEADPIVMFQDSMDPWFALFMCFVLPAMVNRPRMPSSRNEGPHKSLSTWTSGQGHVTYTMVHIQIDMA